MRTSESIKHIAEALSKAQSLITGAVKDSVNPHFKSKFADLESVIGALKGPLNGLGISYSQLGGYEGSQFGINTLIMHSSGEWISGFYPIICKDSTDPQKLLAATTYARRGSLSAAFGLSAVDDDGNFASEPRHHSAPVKAPEDFITTKNKVIARLKDLGYTESALAKHLGKADIVIINKDDVEKLIELGKAAKK